MTLYEFYGTIAHHWYWDGFAHAFKRVVRQMPYERAMEAAKIARCVASYEEDLRRPVSVAEAMEMSRREKQRILPACGGPLPYSLPKPKPPVFYKNGLTYENDGRFGSGETAAKISLRNVLSRARTDAVLSGKIPVEEEKSFHGLVVSRAAEDTVNRMNIAALAAERIKGVSVAEYAEISPLSQGASVSLQFENGTFLEAEALGVFQNLTELSDSVSVSAGCCLCRIIFCLHDVWDEYEELTPWLNPEPELPDELFEELLRDYDDPDPDFRYHVTEDGELTDTDPMA